MAMSKGKIVAIVSRVDFLKKKHYTLRRNYIGDRIKPWNSCEIWKVIEETIKRSVFKKCILW